MRALLTVLMLTFAAGINAADFSDATWDLIEEQDCLTCHALDQEATGPAFVEIAARYRDDPNAVATLVESVREGQADKWGLEIMPPHDDVPDAAIEQLVRCILALETGEAC